MTSITHFSLTALFFMLVLTAAVGQPGARLPDASPDYHVQHFTDENGLPQISVKSIARDQRGNIWLATERGVVRYDGQHFVSFDQFGDSFADRNIRGFHLNTAAHGERFIALNHSYISIQISAGKAHLDSAHTGSLADRHIRALQGKMAWLVESLPDANEQRYPDTHHSAVLVYPGPDKRHFAYDEKYVTYYSDNEVKKTFYFPDRKLFNFFRLGENLYYLDDKLGVFRFPGKGTDTLPARTRISGSIAKNPLLGKRKYEIYWTNCTGQAFILLGQTLYLLQADKKGALTSKLVLDGFDFKSNVIKTIYFDQITGRAFLGSPLNGLFIVEKKRFRAVTSRLPVADEVYYGQTFFEQNKILTAKGVLFDLADFQSKTSSSRIATMARVLDWDRYCILKDSRSSIWAKQGGKLFRFDNTGSRIMSSSFLASGITLMYEGFHDRIWIGTTLKGLYYIDMGDPKAVPHLFSGKSLRNISWVQQQTDRLLWIGTGSGLFKVDILTGKFWYVRGLENIYVRSLYIPQGRDEIWITTYSSGFFLLKGGKLTRFPLDRAQNLASAHCIVEDKNGFFWITTNRGLFQIKRSDLLDYVAAPTELYYHYYSKTAGFNTNEFNGGCQPCALRAANGTVSFPSINGLVWFNPEQINPELPTEGIYIDEITSNGKKQDAAGDALTLPPGNGNLVVKLNAPYFGNGENLRLFYQITKGNQPFTGWMDLDNQNLTITAPNLEPGEYTLSICKKAGFGRDNYIASKIEITVQSHWYETRLFKALLIIIIVAISLLSVRRRVSKIQKENLILEARVIDRTEHLEKTLRVLSDSEKELEQRIRLQFYIIASISHDIRSPMRYMSRALQHIEELMDHKEYEKVIETTAQIGQASQKIFQIADNIVNFIRPEVYGSNRNFSWANLAELTGEKVALFDQIATERGARIQTEIDPLQNVYTDARLLGVVIYNLIDNALKVEDGISIRIHTQIMGGRLYLRFRDQGSGMPQDLMQWLNDQTEQAPPGRYEGLGLLMIRQIAKLLHISIHVQNDPGACVDIIFEESAQKA